MPAVPVSPGAGLDPASRIGAVHLTVADLDRAVSFYCGPVGLEVHGGGRGAARVGAGGGDLLVLNEDPSAPSPAGRTGLFHVAFLVPSRLELGRALERLRRAEVRVTGAADHLVSEAIYLEDPEGNGIEIYRDRPRAEWPLREGRIRMASDPLDVQGVLSGALAAQPTPARAAAATRVGHVHLRVADAAAAEAFYRAVVGLDVMARYPGASFLAVGGYHHQLAVNQWGSAGAPPPPVGAAGLDHFELLVADLDAVQARAGGHARRLDARWPGAGGGLEVADPSGNRMLLLEGIVPED